MSWLVAEAAGGLSRPFQVRPRVVAMAETAVMGWGRGLGSWAWSTAGGWRSTRCWGHPVPYKGVVPYTVPYGRVAKCASAQRAMLARRVPWLLASVGVVVAAGDVEDSRAGRVRLGRGRGVCLGGGGWWAVLLAEVVGIVPDSMYMVV